MARVSYETYDNMDLADEKVSVVLVHPKKYFLNPLFVLWGIVGTVFASAHFGCG